MREGRAEFGKWKHVPSLALLIIGVAAVILGFVCIFVPGITVHHTAVIIGTTFLLVGIAEFLCFATYGGLRVFRSWMLADIALDLILGALFLMEPVIATNTLAWLWAVIVIVCGAMAVLSAIWLMRKSERGWFTMVAAGALAIGLGVIMLGNPESLRTLLGIALIIRGFMAMISAFVTPGMIEG